VPSKSFHPTRRCDEEIEQRCRQIEHLSGPQQKLLEAAVAGDVTLTRRQSQSAEALLKRGLIVYIGPRVIRATEQAKETWDIVAKSFI